MLRSSKLSVGVLIIEYYSPLLLGDGLNSKLLYFSSSEKGAG